MFGGVFLPAKYGIDVGKLRHRRPVSLCNPSEWRKWLWVPPALGAGGLALLVSVQVSVGPGQMRTEGKGAQDISRSVIVK